MTLFFKNLLPVVYAIIGLYLLFTLLFFFISDEALYHPRYQHYASADQLNFVQSQTGERIAIVDFKNPNARYTVLLSHGNGETLGDIYHSVLKDWQAHGYAIVSYDYPGYGESSGKPSEASVEAAADAAYQYVVQHDHVAPKQIILMGYSLGSGPTIHLAAQHKTAGVIIQSGFISAYRVVTHYPIFLGDKFENLRQLSKIHDPMLFIHGTADQTIPFYHGQTLYRYANKPKMFLWVEGANHIDINTKAKVAYWQTIDRFAQLISHP